MAKVAEVPPGARLFKFTGMFMKVTRYYLMPPGDNKAYRVRRSDLAIQGDTYHTIESILSRSSFTEVIPKYLQVEEGL